MKYLIIIILSVLLFASCNHYKWLANHPEEACRICPSRDTISLYHHDTTIVSDTVVYMDQDSAIITMWFECDSLNQVFIQQIRELKSGQKIIYKYILKDNKLEIKMWSDSIAYYKSVISKISQDKKEVVRTITKTEIVRSGVFYVWFFWIIAVLIVLYLVWLYLKQKYLRVN